MLFNSIQFLFFFPIVTLLYFLLPYRQRWILLLLASCYFYMFFIPYYILILIFTIVIDYAAGILIEKAKTKRKRKQLLLLSIFANVGVLAFFKYYNFFINNVNGLFNALHVHHTIVGLNIILPIGLSFHTFQAMSYTIEVYKGNFKAEKHFGIYALYVMFFPQLVAGPIERPQHVLPQLHSKFNFDVEWVLSGLRLVIWGLFKKVVIADRFSHWVNPIYDSPLSHDGWALLTATYLFAIQIYCDFSGYSDIAVGTARVLGVNLMQNFNTPYLATSISDFWRRWHISLSSWFRDYVYIPLGGNKASKPKWLFNLFVVFLISGLWHGANWTFVIWGAIHGIYLITGTLTEKFRANILSKLKVNAQSLWMNVLNIIVTFHLVTFAWIFFRAKNIYYAWIVITKIIHSIGEVFSLNIFSESIVPLTEFEKSNLHPKPLVIVIGIILMTFLFWFEKKVKVSELKLSRTKNYFYFITLIMLVILLGQSIQEQFIYFQF